MKLPIVRIGGRDVDADTPMPEALPEHLQRSLTYDQGECGAELLTAQSIRLPSLRTHISTPASMDETGEDVSIELLWVPIRGEWIGYVHGHNTTYESIMVGYESYPVGGLYRLTEHHATIILEAYGLRQGVIPLPTVLRTSPKELSGLARQLDHVANGTTAASGVEDTRASL